MTPSWGLGSNGTENRLKEWLPFVLGRIWTPEGAQLTMRY